MATNLVNSIPQACFSSAMPDVRVTTDADFVVCTVRDGSNALVIQLKSYPYEGEATFADLKSVVGEWLLANNLISQRFTILVSESWDEQEAVITAETLVAYCAYGLKGVEFEALVEQRFLTTLQSKVIYPNVKERLACLVAADADAADSEASTTLKIEGFKLGDNGKLVAFAAEVSADTSTADDESASQQYACKTYELSLETIAAKVGAKPLAFTCYVGNRAFTFYAAKEQPPCAFLFRNAFNAIETAAFRGVTTAKQEVEREEAVSGGTTAFYDENTKQTFEVETAALAPDFAAWIAQMLASPDVRLWQAGKAWDDLPRVLITESTYEVSDADTDQRTVKFTWRFADDTPQFAAAQLLPVGIFSAPYNPLFS